MDQGCQDEEGADLNVVLLEGTFDSGIRNLTEDQILIFRRYFTQFLSVLIKFGFTVNN